MKNLFLAALSLTVSLAVPSSNVGAHEPTEELRLIEVQPGGPQRWVGKKEMDRLSLQAHLNGRCGGYMDVTHFRSIPTGTPVKALINFDKIQPKFQSTVQPLLQNADAGALMATVIHLSTSYHNRYYDNSSTGVAAAQWIKSQYEKIGKIRNDVQVELVQHRRFDQPSVIATIEGSGPDKNEIVILGGHLDSINHDAGIFKNRAHAPGADDNASGVSTVLHAFKILVESGFKPNRTIKFMSYAGEEAGLLGSQDIADRFRKNGSAVASVMQLDMTMFPGPNPVMHFITDNTHASLTQLLIRLTDHYVKVKWDLTDCEYACSDHASWHRNGYPASFPFEAYDVHENIHTANDTSEKLDSNHGLHFLKLALAYLVEVSNAD